MFQTHLPIGCETTQGERTPGEGNHSQRAVLQGEDDMQSRTNNRSAITAGPQWGSRKAFVFWSELLHKASHLASFFKS